MENGPERLGKYYILERLAIGGMAEIFLARLASPEGAGRIVIIKRIQTELRTKKDFQQMFESEIKVSMGFDHPNIVKFYEFGEEDRLPYIVMEWVNGRNVLQLTQRLGKVQEKCPTDFAVQIIEQAARGLHYAHHFRSADTGESLHIVHRDVSPLNLMVSFNGIVKVIDFGIAKASINPEATRVGVIKGKPNYLSPEQINGTVLDGRSDLFSLATVLWELLTGRQLFPGNNPIEVIKMIESCNTCVTPPSATNPDIPDELDYIVLKALARHREKRYQSVEEFQRMLQKFLSSRASDLRHGTLETFMKGLFKEEIDSDRKKFQRLNDAIEMLIPKAAPSGEIVVDGNSKLFFNEGKWHVCGRRVPRAQIDSSAHPADLIFSGLSESVFPVKTIAEFGAFCECDLKKFDDIKTGHVLDATLILENEKYEIECCVRGFQVNGVALEFARPSEKLREQIQKLYEIELFAASLDPFISYTSIEAGSNSTLIYSDSRFSHFHVAMIDEEHILAVVLNFEPMGLHFSWRRSGSGVTGSMPHAPLEVAQKNWVLSFVKNLSGLRPSFVEDIESIVKTGSLPKPKKNPKRAA